MGLVATPVEVLCHQDGKPQSPGSGRGPAVGREATDGKGEGVLGAQTAASGVQGQGESGARRYRKRQRPTPLCTDAPDGVLGEHSNSGGGVWDAQADASGGVSSLSHVSEFSLSLRVAENDSLLDDLLGIVGGRDREADGRLRHSTRGCTEEGVFDQSKLTAKVADQSDACSPPSPPPLPFSSRAPLKDLRALCAGAGLDSCGTEVEPLQPLRAFGTEAPVKAAAAATAGTGAPALVDCARAASPVPCSPPLPPPLEPDTSGPSGDGGGGAGRLSPPRTTFLYRAPNSGGSSATPPREEEQGRVTDAREPPPQGEQRQQQRRQRTVPSPLVFVKQFLAKAKGTRPVHRPSDGTAPPEWQLLVDHREKIRGSHDKVMDVVRRTRAPCVSAVLPCGDFMLNVDVNTPSPTADAVAEQQPQAGEGLYPSLYSLVVERKTVADLDSSIKGSRYVEQRRLLSLSPFQRVLWLVEGTAVHGRKEESGEGQPRRRANTDRSRRRTAKNHSPTSSDSGFCANLPDVQGRISSACASLSMQPRFTVVRTRSIAESAAFLQRLAVALVSRLTATPHPPLLPTTATLTTVLQLQRRLCAVTALPRMLMCIRGCSASLAMFIVRKYGSLYKLWRVLREGGGPEACDTDPDIQRLPLAQRRVVVLLSEFILATEYH